MPRSREPRREHERVRDEAAHGVAGGRELRGLRDGVAEHQLRPKRVPQPALPQHRLGRAAVGRDIGVGDGEAADAAGLHQARQTRRAARRRSAANPFGAKITSRPTAYTTPASRVRPAAASWFGNSSSAARNISNGAPSWICRVNVPDAPNTSSTRVCRVARELLRDLGQRQVQVRRRRNRGRARSCEPGDRQARQPEREEPAAYPIQGARHRMPDSSLQQESHQTVSTIGSRRVNWLRK